MMISGKTYRLPDNKFNDVNTDEILSGPYMRLPEDQLGQYAFYSIIDDFKNQVKDCNILIAGRNMGCGSSREQAPKALLRCGIKLIIAHSFGYIFYRNAINLGLTLLKVTDEALLISLRTGQILDVNLEDGSICIDKKIIKRTCPLDKTSLKILNSGGLMNLLKNKIDII